MKNKLGLFRLADRGFAVPLERLLRVVEQGDTGFLPLLPQGMAGVLVLDNELIPLLDSDWYPGVEAGRGLCAGFKVLLATEYGPVALPADATAGIVATRRGEWTRPEQATAEYLSDSFSYRANRYAVLNVDVFIMSLIRS